MNKNQHEKVENIDLILKSTWLAVSKMYSELAQDHDATAVQALTLLKIDPKEGTRSTNLGPKMAIEPTSLTRIIKLTEKGLNSRNLSKEVVVNFNKKVVEKIPQEKMEIFKEVMTDILKIANELNNKK